MSVGLNKKELKEVEGKTQRDLTCIDYFHHPIMQYVLGWVGGGELNHSSYPLF